jgi:uncharacterized Zn finger protein
MEYLYFLTCQNCGTKQTKRAFLKERPVEAGGGFQWQCPECGNTDPRELKGSKESPKKEAVKK